MKTAKKEAPKLTDEDMKRIRRIRENTCIHGCYYADTPDECVPAEENGIPNCKREIELILRALESRKPERGKPMAEDEDICACCEGFIVKSNEYDSSLGIDETLCTSCKSFFKKYPVEKPGPAGEREVRHGEHGSRHPIKGSKTLRPKGLQVSHTTDCCGMKRAALICTNEALLGGRATALCTPTPCPLSGLWWHLSEHPQCDNEESE